MQALAQAWKQLWKWHQWKLPTNVFDGKKIAQKCDYGVRVCTDYIKLPKSMRVFPPEDNDPPFGCRWVRKAVFISMLDTLATPKK
jgi:hypothetical protein